MPTLFAPMEDLLDPSPGETPAEGHAQARRAADILAWISGLLALPGAYGALIGFFIIIPPLLFLIGCILLAGYIRAARQSPESPGPGRVFWWSSISFNALLLAATLVILLGHSGDVGAGEWVMLALACWQATAIHLSARALRAC